MTRDEIINLACQETAGLTFLCAAHGFTDELKAFATLVVAAERQACLAVVKKHLTAARLDHRHLGLGDIRLSMANQEEIERAIRTRGEP